MKLSSQSVRTILLNKVAQPLHQLARRYTENLVWEPFLQNLTDSSVSVHWATPRGESPAVHYSTDNTFNQVAQGTSRPIEALNMYIHSVRLTDLAPNTVYHYKIALNGQVHLSNPSFTFQTVPPTGSGDSFDFAIFGDFGRWNNIQQRLGKQMLQDTFHFIVTVGDNSQMKGTYQQFDRHVFYVYRDLFCRAPIFPALGNHDCLTNNGAPYLAIFDLPRYYAFDCGNVHFTILDSNQFVKDHPDHDAQAMINWLKLDLERTDQPWKIVICHHPPYNAGPHGPTREVQNKLVSIFEAHKVDLVVSGHEHNYQRSKPLKQGQVTTVEDGGIIYIVSGAGATAKTRLRDTGADWLETAIHSVDYGIYNRVRVNGKQMGIKAIDDKGSVKDAFNLSKP